MNEVLINSIIINRECNLVSEKTDVKTHPFLSSLDRTENKEIRFRQILEEYNSQYNAAILEVLGGDEILGNGQAFRWIRNIYQYYNHIEIMTRGESISFEQIRAIRDITSLSLCIHLDGITYEAGVAKVLSQEQFHSVLTNVKRVLEAGICLNIKAFLSPWGADPILEYMEFLLPYKENVTLHVLPANVHAEAEVQETLKTGCIKCIESIMGNHCRYSGFIPPIGYFERLKTFYFTGDKQLQCFVPYFKTLVLIDGRLIVCPENWMKEIGDLSPGAASGNNIFDDGVFKLLNRKKPVLQGCKGFCGEAEIINLYMHGAITLEELAFYKPYGIVEVKNRLQSMKNRYAENLKR